MTEMYEEKMPFTHDSAETFGFLASPSARSYNSGYAVSLRYTQTLADFAYPQNVK
jgi:hypothetical protein